MNKSFKKIMQYGGILGGFLAGSVALISIFQYFSGWVVDIATAKTNAATALQASVDAEQDIKDIKQEFLKAVKDQNAVVSGIAEKVDQITQSTDKVDRYNEFIILPSLGVTQRTIQTIKANVKEDNPPIATSTATSTVDFNK